ncbi:phage tail protein [Pseudomonas syringae pv. actinidiae]|nr:phage tail protein [Pseudomonas syringae pv. actinidiae]
MPNTTPSNCRRCCPPGPAWDPERVPELQQVITGLSREFARIDGRAFDLLNEMDPATVSELVPDWERVMNLPDPCLGLKPLFADRRLSVRQRLVATGGQNAGFYIDIAVSQGYPDATVTEHRAPRMGRSRFGQAHFGTWSAQFMWTLNTGGRQRLGRRFGASYWGERFGVNPGTAIECLIRRAAPAHSAEFVNFN